MRQIAEQLEAGQETVSAGMGKDIVKTWYDSFGEKFDGPASKWEGKKIHQ